MKPNRILAIVFAFAGISMIAACTDKQPQAVAKNEKAHVKAVNPFPFYKHIEIRPGYHFEVLSWGKGTDTLGGYLILMSDSLKNNYRSIAGERKGVITDAWNMDMDNDGNPEIYIQYVVRQHVNDLNVYEFGGNGFDKLSFPGLNSKLKKDYQGNDKFFVKNGELFRSVPLVETDSGKTTTLIKTLKYDLRGNVFNASEVKEE